MGVHGLWKLVEATGEAVPLDNLRGLTVAVDASVWLFQFIKALGLVRRSSPHILGFFRRICKLLFIGAKPVFVFDGEAPVLKMRTRKRRIDRRKRAEHHESASKDALLKAKLREYAIKAVSTEKDTRTDPELVNAVYMDLNSDVLPAGIGYKRVLNPLSSDKVSPKKPRS